MAQPAQDVVLPQHAATWQQQWWSAELDTFFNVVGLGSVPGFPRSRSGLILNYAAPGMCRGSYSCIWQGLRFWCILLEVEGMCPISAHAHLVTPSSLSVW